MTLNKDKSAKNKLFKNYVDKISINPRRNSLYNLIIFIFIFAFCIPVLSGTLWAITEIISSKEVPEFWARLLFRNISFILIFYFFQNRRKINDSSNEKNEITSFSDLMKISRNLDIN